MKEIRQLWRDSFSDKRFKAAILSSAFMLIVILLAFSRFVLYVETRNGTILFDPILNALEPFDLTWITFFIIYAGLISAVFVLIKKPKNLLLAINTYIIMVVFRTACMYVVPLDPPVTMIPLNDPFVQLFGSGKILTKDLFFSGHTATLFLFYLVIPKESVRKIFLFATICVGIAVILQHVHYTIDVIAALVFTFVAYRIAKLIMKLIF